MKYGLILRSTGPGASAEAIEAGAATAERLGWESVWTTDHVLVPAAHASEYGRVFEAITTLAWVGARHPGLRLGISVVVVPQRNAVLLAKELASVDALSGGRLVAGVGIGWMEGEFANLGMADRFHHRGAYLDETIRLWRHLWSGSTEPFEGAFHSFREYSFGPLPARRGGVPIVVGGSSEPALRRAGALGDGYQPTRTGPDDYARRIPIIRAAAEQAGRAMPRLSARLAVSSGRTEGRGFRLTGDPIAMAADIRALGELGLEEIELAFEPTEPEQLSRDIERFDREVARVPA
jgi:probable F420-dependent oxidoreductase